MSCMGDESVLHVGIRRFIGFYIECIRGCCIHTHVCSTIIRSHKLELHEYVGMKEARFIDDRTPIQLDNIYLYIHIYVCTVGTLIL